MIFENMNIHFLKKTTKFTTDLITNNMATSKLWSQVINFQNHLRITRVLQMVTIVKEHDFTFITIGLTKEWSSGIDSDYLKLI